MKYVNINVNSDIYKKLSNEEKLKVVREKLKLLFEESKKEKHAYTITYKGNKKVVSKDKFGIFRDLISRERKLEKIVSIDVTSFKVNDNLEKNTKLIDIKFCSEEYNNLTTDEKINVIKAKMEYVESLDETKYLFKNMAIDTLKKLLNDLENKSVILDDNVTTTYTYHTEDVIANNTENTISLDSDERVEEIKKDSLKTKFLALPIVNKISNKSNKLKKKVKNKSKSLWVGFLALPIISKLCKKKKNKKNKKNRRSFKTWFLGLPLIVKMTNRTKKIKKKYNDSAFGRAMKKEKNRVIVFLGASFLALTAMLNSCNSKLIKKVENNNLTNKPSSSQTSNDADEDKNNVENSTPSVDKENTVTEDDIIIDEPTINDEDIPSVDEEIESNEENKCSLGDIITFDEDSKIYTNSYDATYCTNSYNAYFDNSYEREIQGVVYELNGYVYTIYSFDIDAESKIQELENNGAKLTAVLVNRNDITSNNSYEGYYNIESVNIKTRTK